MSNEQEAHGLDDYLVTCLYLMCEQLKCYYTGGYSYLSIMLLNVSFYLKERRIIESTPIDTEYY